MKTYHCVKCGLKFKANAIPNGESKSHTYWKVKCPRCGCENRIKTEKEYGQFRN